MVIKRSALDFLYEIINMSLQVGIIFEFSILIGSQYIFFKPRTAVWIIRTWQTKNRYLIKMVKSAHFSNVMSLKTSHLSTSLQFYQ